MSFWLEQKRRQAEQQKRSPNVKSVEAVDVVETEFDTLKPAGQTVPISPATESEGADE